MNESYEPRIYLLPNIMTAGNLFCGFAATLRILEGAVIQPSGTDADAIHVFHVAIFFILGACVFDLLDGRVARLGGAESPFGREFDSLADIVSFGVAPALLVYRIILEDFPQMGWVIASFYLLCGAMRLARFNCLAAAGAPGAGKEFRGFPIPAAAGLIASITLWMLWLQEGSKELGHWKYVLPVLMVFLSIMMFSRVSYPSFKAVGWRTQRSLQAFLLIALAALITVLNYQWMPMVIFCTYLIYGFVRPLLSKTLRREVEVELGELEESEELPAPPKAPLPDE